MKTKYKVVPESALPRIEAQGIQIIPSVHKKNVNVFLDKKTRKAILHCGKHGQIYLSISDMIDVLNEALDILDHLA